MLKLTAKNYEMLPEVQKKREEELKKKERQDRLKNVREFEQKRLALAQKAD